MNITFSTNPSTFHLWLAVGLAIGLLMMPWSGWAYANGGTILRVDKVGAYELTITASPFPLEVGVNDISVLLGRLSDSQLVLDAKVTMTAEPVDHSGQPQTFPATHDNATNKLYYAANVVFPTAGRWQLTIQVAGSEDSVVTTFDVQVEQRRSLSFLRYLIIGLPLAVIVVIFFVLRRGPEQGFNDHDLEGDEE